jgi:hypothetical protein
MRDSNLALDAGKKAVVLGLGLLGLFVASIALAQNAAAPESYTWSAELVAFDKASNTVTVKQRLVEAPEVANMTALRPGDKAMLTWSGISTAAGIRAIERGEKSSFDRMTMPVELVGTEHDGRYVSFKVAIPAGDAAAIERVQPGQWVTATSPHRPRDAKEAVSSIRPYGHADAS